MEFLLPVLPVLGIAAFLLLALFFIWFVMKLTKTKNVEVPFAKIILTIVVFTVVASGVKLVTSPITRPVMTEVVDDTGAHKVDADIVLVAPTANDNSFKPEPVDTSPTREDEIRSHSKN
ncbi:hypothetical protein VPHD480_0418 [Vibrio phage D480]|nr:hypothetical protein MYOV011v1_p0219 [Vibrio phage 6E35.1a]